MIDITAPTKVAVTIRSDRSVLWINVDGECVLRICRIPALTITDNSKPSEEPDE